MNKFVKELSRRNVFKVGLAYLVVTWLLLQVTDVIASILIVPEWAPKLVLLLLLVGFIPALILAWAFELTPDGIKPSGDPTLAELWSSFSWMDCGIPRWRKRIWRFLYWPI